MILGRPEVLGIVYGALIGGVNAVLQIRELRLKNKQVQPTGVNVLIPGAMGRIVFVAAEIGRAHV